jgi:predicted lipoprotein with Yx(FWY)xxD motif
VLKKSRLVSVAALLAVLAATATALASSSTTTPVKTRKTAALGTFLVDGKGRTLYLFDKDDHGKSVCSRACAVNWPPYLTAKKPTAGRGVKKALLGTTRRSDGKLQVTYNHHPLYRFKLDTRAGLAKGESIHAFGGEWNVVSPRGAKIEPRSSHDGSSDGDHGGGGGGGGSGPTGPTGGGYYPPPPGYKP